jgi:hypothetical protein
MVVEAVHGTGRLRAVVAIAGGVYLAWWLMVELLLPGSFNPWVCLLVGHYCYLLIGNHGDSTWWVGAFVTFAAAGCACSRVVKLRCFLSSLSDASFAPLRSKAS